MKTWVRKTLSIAVMAAGALLIAPAAAQADSHSDDHSRSRSHLGAVVRSPMTYGHPTVLGAGLNIPLICGNAVRLRLGAAGSGIGCVNQLHRYNDDRRRGNGAHSDSHSQFWLVHHRNDNDNDNGRDDDRDCGCQDRDGHKGNKGDHGSKGHGGKGHHGGKGDDDRYAAANGVRPDANDGYGAGNEPDNYGAKPDTVTGSPTNTPGGRRSIAVDEATDTVDGATEAVDGGVESLGLLHTLG